MLSLMQEHICWNPPSQLTPLCAQLIFRAGGYVFCCLQNWELYICFLKTTAFRGIPFVFNFHIDVVSYFHMCLCIFLTASFMVDLNMYICMKPVWPCRYNWKAQRTREASFLQKVPVQSLVPFIPGLFESCSVAVQLSSSLTCQDGLIFQSTFWCIG